LYERDEYAVTDPICGVLSSAGLRVRELRMPTTGTEIV
jgi:hypothetical protein